jgi:hypothetical protein
MATTDPRPVGLFPAGLVLPSTLRQPAPEEAPLPDAIDVDLTIDGPVDGVSFDPATGAMQTELDDGSVVVDFSPPARGRDKSGADKHDANLAEHIDSGELGRIADELLRGIETDEQSRTEWLEAGAQGIRLLGLTIDNPSQTGADASTAVAGQSTVRHPLLLEATLRFQANARGELLPASGPVKVDTVGAETTDKDALAEALEDGLNYYLTDVATEYYPDTDRALFYTGFRGCSFKKVYNCPIRRRPVSESVSAEDMIVSNASTDMHNSARVTHKIQMRPSTLRRMQLAGAYRDVPVGQPNPSLPNPVEEEKNNTQGVDPTNQIPEDRDHTIYEVYCELDIRGFEDKDKGETTGLHLPYRVVIDKDSRLVLEIRRQWDEDDDRKLMKLPFVKYPFVPGLGFYDIGFVHILGNTTNALTAAWRELLDSGMFANFPGFLYSKLAGRQNETELRVPPGGGKGIETNGMAIGDAIMPLPYKDISQAFAAFIDNIAQTGQRLGGTAEVQVAEGRQDAPVGTTLALIEQAMKPMDAVHKRLHAAQSQEFQLLKQCFRENPQAFVDAVNRKGTVTWDEDKFLEALDNASIVPMADPNTPSQMHRLMRAMGVKQLAAQNPTMYDLKEVDTYVMQQAGVADPDRFFAKAPPAAAQPDPKLLEMVGKSKMQDQKIANDQQDRAVKVAMQQRESADQAAERVSREKIAAIGLVSDIIEHPGSDQQAQTDLGQFAPAAE